MSVELASLPGDPVAVSRAADDYLAVAEAIRTAARRLRQIADERTDRSEAVAAVGSKARDVAHQVSRAYGRYAAVAGALRVYADGLRSAQDLADDVIPRGRSASDDLQVARQKVGLAAAAVDAATPDDLAARTRDLEDARCEQDAAQQALDRAVADLDVARTRVATAAQTAAATIREALDDGLDDGWWQNWGKDACRAIASVADVISNAAGILAVVFCWVPFVGELLALVAVVAAAIKLLADLMLVMDGEVTWGDVAWDVAAIVPGGVGRSLGTMARTTTRAARGTARKEAERVAQERTAGVPRAGRPAGRNGVRQKRKVVRQEERVELVGPANADLDLQMAGRWIAGASGKQALKDGLRIFDTSGLAAGREALRGTSLRELWKAAPGTRLSTRVLGDRELSEHLAALRQVNPEKLHASPDLASALTSAARWRRADLGVQGYIGVESVVGAQDFADWRLGNDTLATGGWHAVESLGGIQGDRHATERLNLSGAGR
ncbi:hypothetical protein IC607_09235 [Cellulomonas sp. JH27-2]|uniref:hypothetical protein n=1 Tax=Cellulomonas sp. JH27-2 TaxID=2774139 RepID=UPI001782CC60|nr:hypothetical protein [Cellulomonas sp. JH27-2]MBD8059148.1 hypothetical protein [Cellulomonas sp. JH27-2]